MGNVLFIVWRESLEAVLIIGILHSFLSKSGAGRSGKKALAAGVLSGIGLSAVFAATTLVVQDTLTGRALDLFQAATFFISAALMTQMVFWMNRHGRRMKQDLEAGLTRAMDARGLWGVVLVSALAVAREGSETVVYLYSLFLENSAQGTARLLAFATAGLVLALVTAWSVSRGIKLLNYGTFFKLTSLVLLISAAGLVATGTCKLIELDTLPALMDPVWNTSWIVNGSSTTGRFLSAFTGYRPRPSLMLVIAYGVYWAATLSIMTRRAPGRAEISMSTRRETA